jgi:hypothetical protein
VAAEEAALAAEAAAATRGPVPAGGIFGAVRRTLWLGDGSSSAGPGTADYETPRLT